MNAKLRSVMTLGAIGALALAGCAGNSTKPPAAATAPSGDATKGQSLAIGFVPGIASDPFFRAMQLGAEAKAAELGITLLWQGAPDEYSPQSQLPFVNALLTQGVDGLVLVPTDPDALQPSVQQAKELGVPVITVDTTVTDQSYLTSYITGDNVQGGQLAARTLAEQIGDSGKVWVQSGSPTATTNVLRLRGFQEEMAKHPNIQVVGVDYSNSQPATATSKITNVLLEHPDLKGIFAIDGTSGTGAVAALRNAQKVGKVKLIGYDAYENQVADLREGVYSALIAQQPGKEAELALQYLVDVLNGKPEGVKKELVLENVVMTQDNLDKTKQYQYPAK